MTGARTRSEAGFTLVEMLVALVVFALLSAAGVALLQSSVAAQGRIAERLEADRNAQRIVALFQADVSQAIARPLTGVGARRDPSLEGSSSRLSLIRGGWANPGQHPRSTLQRVTWTARGDSVRRTAHLYLDGTDPGAAAGFADGVRGIRFRYRLIDGSWSDRFSPSERQLLPAAVEMTVARARGPLVIVAALPPRGAERDPRTLPGAQAA